MAENHAWNPWRELRKRPHLAFELTRLPDGVRGLCWPRDGKAAILIDDRLSQQERNVTLTHEILHADRGTPCRDDRNQRWLPVVAREESRIDDDVARLHVPAVVLYEFIGAMRDLDLSVGPVEVAERFGVPSWTAARALSLHARRELSRPVERKVG